MKFSNCLKSEILDDYSESYTENGAKGYSTTGKDLLDLNFSVASMRKWEEEKITSKFDLAYNEDRMHAIKWIFYAGDVRGGLGERRLFNILYRYLIKNHTYEAQHLLELIPEYTRWSNLVSLIKYDEISDQVVKIVSDRLESDMVSSYQNKPISLLAKWMPSINASSKATVELARKWTEALHMSDKKYRKMLSYLRKYLNVVEVKMSSNDWEDIDYSAVPSRANLIYKDAFLKHDGDRRNEYLQSLSRGDTKINAGVLFPHDIIHKYVLSHGWRLYIQSNKDDTIEQLWKNLPDFIHSDSNTIVVADGSGSMTNTVDTHSSVTALEVADALAIYFAEHSTGEFHNKYITFSENPKYVDFDRYHCETLHDKFRTALEYDECANTDIYKVFMLILNTARRYHLNQNEIPKNILIISDMEFDYATSSKDRNEYLFKSIGALYSNAGYKLPRLVFWNVNSRTNTIPITQNELGVALVSGFSPAICKMVLSGEFDPYKCLLNELDSDRYKDVEIALKSKSSQNF